MNNEPVAWMSPEGWVYGLHETRPSECNIPLYTHPLKELTNEEVIKIIKRFIGTEPLVHEIEQAILRKAQEK